MMVPLKVVEEGGDSGGDSLLSPFSYVCKIRIME